MTGAKLTLCCTLELLYEVRREAAVWAGVVKKGFLKEVEVGFVL